MRAPNRYALPEEMMPETSYEYGCDEELNMPWPLTPAVMAEQEALHRRNRNVLVHADNVVRTEYGGIRKVRGTRILGKNYDFMEKF
jgi:hypothetical protein